MNKPAKLAPDKRKLIADGLLAGGNFAAVRQQMIDAGVSPAAADYELRRAEKEPFFQAALQIRRDLEKSYWVLRIHETLNRQRADELVPTINSIEPERFLESFYFTNRPVKLTGLIEHWPALRLWNLDYLEQRLGDAVVELQGQRDTTTNYEVESNRLKVKQPMRQVVAAVRDLEASNNFYLTANNTATNRASLAPLWDDLRPIGILDPSSDRDGFFWFGPKGTLTPFHHDLTNNLLVQVLGRKRVLLIPPWELAGVQNHLHVFSRLGPADVTLGAEGVPQAHECVIGPGEALFIPVGWWHHVEALDVSISMSFTNFPLENDFTAGHPLDQPFS